MTTDRDLWGAPNVEINVLMGKTLVSVEREGGEQIIFTLDDGTKYVMYHENNCCESVTIEDIAGDLEDLVGSPITMAEMVTNDGDNPPGVTVPDYQESFTWTFYKLATIKGYVTIRWYGESNGYYSEDVDFKEIPNDDRAATS